jgi:hypothetical protein
MDQFLAILLERALVRVLDAIHDGFRRDKHRGFIKDGGVETSQGRG